VAIGFPVFSYGTCPVGPLRVDARAADALTEARFGTARAGREDAVFADDDGALLVASAQVDVILDKAEAIRATERQQAERIAAGETLRDQLRFAAFLQRRAGEPHLTFRAWLREIGGAIEE
jgi:regulator of RNase E activity RraA